MTVSWCNPCSQMTLDVTQDGVTTCFRCGRSAGTPPDVIHPQPLPQFRLAPTLTGTAPGPCPCACNHGGFCGGCGHAGCGGRR